MKFLLGAIFSCAAAGLRACVSCKDALGTTTEGQALGRGFYYSIFFMLFMIFGVVGLLVLRIVREARAQRPPA